MALGAAPVAWPAEIKEVSLSSVTEKRVAPHQVTVEVAVAALQTSELPVGSFFPFLEK